MSCPLIESNHLRCSEYLSLTHLEEAYEICSDHYYQCPLYLEMSRAQPQSVDAKVAVLAK
jgi:hypothetical protein